MGSMIEEVWKQWPGDTDYEVSSMGNVRSWKPKPNSSVRPHAPRTLKGSISPSVGYLTVRIGRKRHYVHTLVLELFVGSRPDGAVSRHLNDDRLDNRSCNLSWGSYSDNAFDRVRNNKDHNSKKTHAPCGHKYNARNSVTGGRLCSLCKKH